MKGTGGTWGAADIRCNRLASVGLIVRAPRPVAWGGIMDTRLDDDEDGVEAAAGAWFFTGVRTALVDEDRE